MRAGLSHPPAQHKARKLSARRFTVPRHRADFSVVDAAINKNPHNHSAEQFAGEAEEAEVVTSRSCLPAAAGEEKRQTLKKCWRKISHSCLGRQPWTCCVLVVLQLCLALLPRWALTR